MLLKKEKCGRLHSDDFCFGGPGGKSVATYTYTVITYPCTRCRADVLKRPGFITTPVIACHVCGHEMLVTREVVLNHWQKSLFRYLWMFLVIAGVAFYFAVPGGLSASVWELVYRSNFMGEPYDTIMTYGIIFAILAVGAAVISVVVSLVAGGVIGNMVANKICTR